MSRKRKSSEEGKLPVPAYIVTFSDMITLLLTFFVLLLSMASEQKEELFTAGALRAPLISMKKLSFR